MGRPLGTAAAAVGLLLLAGLVVAWSLRFRAADHVLDGRLAAAHVPARYRLTRLGPFAARIEDVRVGDPAAPDLAAARIDLAFGYGLSGLRVRSVRAEGVRVRGRIERTGLSLGALDRLLPRSGGGGAALPDIGLVLHDVALSLATPGGTVQAMLDGSGNPQRVFRGRAHVAAPTLRIGSCTIVGAAASLRLGAQGGRPDAQGPAEAARVACPGLAVGRGRATLALATDAGLQRLVARAALDGFGGSAGPVRFAGIAGPIVAQGRPDALDARAHLRLASLSVPVAARALTAGTARLAGLPIGPTAARAAAAAATLLADADADATLTATVNGTGPKVDVRAFTLAGRDGARLRAIARGGLGWSTAGWRADADVATDGGGLPSLALRLRQAAPGGPLDGVGRLAPYQAGAARVAAAPLRVTWDRGAIRFAALVRVDGPIGTGFMQGLEAPVRGEVNARGRFALGRGCQPLAFRAARLGSVTLEGARLAVCGRPAILRGGAGTVRVAATAGPIRLGGRTDGGAPVTLAVGGLRLSERGFAAGRIAATVGATHLALGSLSGTFAGGGAGGGFADASGAVGAVPLRLSDAGGRWRFAGGVLRLDAALRVSDATAMARFRPLAVPDAVLRLRDTALAATGTLREPATGVPVARVALRHDLASGRGDADLRIDDLHFAPKGLQPDALTPLTLGVIANVAGSVRGAGRIVWGPAGVTSTGTFGTDRLDLAAAFGPVTGISGRIDFTDLLGLVSAPHQEARIAEINPGIAIADGVVRYQLVGANRVAVEDGRWPFAGGTLRLEPATLDLSADAERRLGLRVEGLDAAAFVQQLDFPNIAATGTFDGVLPMVFDRQGGRVVGGAIATRPPGGSLAYVGELSRARLGAMGKLAFDALKAIRYTALGIDLDGRLDGEMVSRVRFTGVREATPEQGFAARLLRNLPFRFDIQVRAPFRGLVGSARAYMDPRLLLGSAPPPAVQPSASAGARQGPGA